MTRIVLLLLATCALGVVVAYPKTVVSNSLLNTLHRSATANIAIILKGDVSLIYDQVAASGLVFSARGQKMTIVRSALIEYTSEAQAALRFLLDTKGFTYNTYWITNRIIVANANLELVKELSFHPDVAEIREEIVIPLEPVTRSSFMMEEKQQFPVRGVFMVGAPDLWDAGFTGEGIVTSNIDTGVRGTHRILRNNFLGEYGWYDPNGRSAAPNDGNGHGTHTMGTIAGQEGFGVAPDSRWMACKGCATSSCSESDLLGCGQFIACPTLTDGTAANCTKAPHVVGNSWGSSSGGQNWYDNVIQGWAAADVIGVFSAGNSGAGCNTVGSPGDRNGVISVAATDFSDRIATFSSRGPASGAGAGHKPELSAPGVEVLSSYIEDDDSFTRLSGTSMASPHVTGGVALFIQKNPTLAGNYEAIRAALFAGAKISGLIGSSQTCGGVNDGTFPNHVFGYGRLYLPAASSKL